MIDTKKSDLLREKINLHLRKTARQLVKFDTLDETLHYLIQSFWDQFSCDYVSIILKNGENLEIKSDKGEPISFARAFPMNWQDCSNRFWVEPDCSYNFHEEGRCAFHESLDAEGFATWFTVPIKESDSNSLGICVIGFRDVVPFVMDADKLFIEFGKDIAAAMGMAIEKESEKKKISGMEWLKENVYLGSSIEQLIKNIVERAGKGTHAESAYVYLYDEFQNCFLYQPPSYGPMLSASRIQLDENYHLFHHFSFLERPGGGEITIPLIVNLKTIGVLHVLNKGNGLFTQEDLELLQFLASHVSVLIENARLYKSELEDKSRLEELMIHHQELVKQTLVGEGFEQITQSLSQMIRRSVILFDRFFRPISSSFREEDQSLESKLLAKLDADKWVIANANTRVHWMTWEDEREFGIWKVIGGGELLGYLGISLSKKELDMVLRMTLNQAINVFAIQFVKQKLILDAKEQVKDSFINQLFVERIEDKERLMEYSNLFKLNLHEPNIVGLISIEFNDSAYNQADLLDIEEKKTWIWERIREDLSQKEPGVILTRKDGFYIIITSEKKSLEKKNYWDGIYQRMKKVISQEFKGIEVFLGISQSAKGVDDYYTCYKQAIQTLKIVNTRYRDKGFLTFDSLGSYTVLHQLQETFSATLFLKKYLDPILDYGNGNGKGKELFLTLRIYLQMNGNLKDTSEHLFIHRSSLKYRLEKIRELLDVNIDDAEERFNLMLAYKLYDLYHF